VRIQVRLFAIAKQVAGCDSVELELPDGATIGQLRSRLSVQIPQLASLVPRMMFAIDTEYAHDDAAIPPDSDVACIPPVSGG